MVILFLKVHRDLSLTVCHLTSVFEKAIHSSLIVGDEQSRSSQVHCEFVQSNSRVYVVFARGTVNLHEAEGGKEDDDDPKGTGKHVKKSELLSKDVRYRWVRLW